MRCRRAPPPSHWLRHQRRHSGHDLTSLGKKINAFGRRSSAKWTTRRFSVRIVGVVSPSVFRRTNSKGHRRLRIRGNERAVPWLTFGSQSRGRGGGRARCSACQFETVCLERRESSRQMSPDLWNVLKNHMKENSRT